MSLLPWIAVPALFGISEYTNPIAKPGEANYQPNPTHHLRLSMDNDVVFEHDKDYTHGTRFDYAQALPSGNYWGASLTQNIYTPRSVTQGNVEGEHPYAGYLALGAAYITSSENFATSTEIQLGTTGRPSLAEQTQDLVHSLGDMYSWTGWDDQIRAEFTMQISSRQDWNIAALDYTAATGWQQDGMVYTKEELGTVSIAASTGFVYRIGKNLPSRMRNMSNKSTDFGVGTLTKADYDPEKISYFMLSGISLEYIARDMFIDGGVFHDFETTCSKVPWVAELQWGIGVVYQHIDYYFGMVYRTDSYRTQKESTLYGTFSIGWNW